MALWPAKKDQDDDSEPVKIDIPAQDDTPDLEQLTQRLSEMENMLGQANKQMLSYLMHRDQQATIGADDNRDTQRDTEKIDSLSAKVDQLTENLDKLTAIATDASGQPSAAPAAAGSSPKVAAVDEETMRAAMVPLQDKLDGLDTQIKSLSETLADPTSTAEAIKPALQQIFGSVNEQKEASSGAFRQLWQRLDDGLSEVIGYLRPPEPDTNGPGPAAHGDWEEALLGRELAENPALIFQRQQLIEGTLSGQPASCSLVGQLLVFQSSPADKMPQLLKEVGEAYYRWQPKTTPQSNAMEEILTAWLKRICDENGIGNTIELVHPGERFDSSRHNAATRGVEISEVRGWIVLRDNGRVYTKANVVAK
jgi:hypothetical protein